MPRPASERPSLARPKAVLDALDWPLIPTSPDRRKLPLVPARQSWRDDRFHIKPTDAALRDAAAGKRLLSLVCPSDVVVIDIDDASVLPRLQKHCDVDLLASTLAVETGAGFHLYYRMPKDNVNVSSRYKRLAKDDQLPKKYRYWSTIDVRTNGYMIAPPSLHWRKEKHYTFVDNGHEQPVKMPKGLRALFDTLATLSRSAVKTSGINGHPVELTADERKNIGEPKLTLDTLKQLLDSLSPSVYANDWQAFHRIAGAIHFSTAGSKKARKMFLQWAAGDEQYDSPEHRMQNGKIWDSFKLDPNKRQYTHRTLIKELQTHSVLGESHSLYGLVGDAQRAPNRKTDEQVLALFRSKVDTVPLAVKQDDTFIDIPGFPRERIAEAMNGTQSDRDELITGILNDTDISDPDFSAKIETMVYIVEKASNPADRDIWQQRIIKFTGLKVSTYNQIRKAVKVKLQQATGSEIQDIVGRATRLYAERNEVIASVGTLYERIPNSVFYRSLNEHALGAKLVDMFRADLQLLDRENLPATVRNAIELLKLERNVDDRLRKQVKKVKPGRSMIVEADRIPWRHNSIFQVQQDLHLCEGRCVVNTRNAEVQINWSKHLSKIRKRLGSKSVDDWSTGKTDVVDLLQLPIDVQLSGISGVQTIDDDRSKKYYLDSAPVDYLSDKTTLKALNTGRVQNFCYYLDLVTATLKADDKRLFISTFLDVLAYAIQPVRHSSMFVLFHGRSGAGKSLACLLMNALTAPSIVTKRSLAALVDNEEFGMQRVAGKWFVYEDDAKSFTRETVAKLKEISHGNQVLEVSLKHENTAHTFLSRHLIGILTNIAPRMTDPSGAIERRVQMFRFPRTISKEFDEYTNGLPMLTHEATVIFNLLRLRMPRVLATPKWFQPAFMKADIAAMTRSDMLSQTIEQTLQHKAGKKAKVNDVFSEYRTRNMLYNSSRSGSLPFTAVADRLREYGFMVENDLILNAKFKSSK